MYILKMCWMLDPGKKEMNCMKLLVIQTELGLNLQILARNKELENRDIVYHIWSP